MATQVDSVGAVGNNTDFSANASTLVKSHTSLQSTGKHGVGKICERLTLPADGFRGIKKQWLIKYYEEQREAEQVSFSFLETVASLSFCHDSLQAEPTASQMLSMLQRATAAAAAAENDHRNAAEAPVEEVSEGPRPVGSPEGNNEPGQATAGLHEQVICQPQFGGS